MIENSKSALSERNKAWLVQKFNINPRWLAGENVPMTGEGVNAAQLPERLPVNTGGIPVYDLTELQGLGHLFRRSRRPKASGYISIPNMPKCDGAVRIVGDSMHPILRSGDLVLYRQLNDPSEIIWGEMYLISVETSADEYVAVRYIFKSEKNGMAVLAGENPRFSDKEVNLSKISALAFVKATIRMNALK